MMVQTLAVGELKTNCYLLINDKGNAIVIDPADEAEKIIDRIKEQNLSVKAILLTHGHFDHIMATNQVKKEFNCPVIIGEPDEEMLNDDEKNAAVLMGLHVEKVTADKKVNDGDVLDFDTFRIKVLSTQGHTKGSVCYIVDDIIFSGDTLFYESVGRCDLYGGNAMKLMQSLKKIARLEGEFDVFPGHGYCTKLSHEKEHNRWLKSVI